MLTSGASLVTQKCIELSDIPWQLLGDSESDWHDNTLNWLYCLLVAEGRGYPDTCALDTKLDIDYSKITYIDITHLM